MNDSEEQISINHPALAHLCRQLTGQDMSGSTSADGQGHDMTGFASCGPALVFARECSAFIGQVRAVVAQADAECGELSALLQMSAERVASDERAAAARFRMIATGRA